MSKRAGQLLWNRMNLTVDPATPLDVDTSIWQPNRSFAANSVGEPTMPEIGADPLLNPSRIQVIPQSPVGNWLGVSHGQPFAHLNVGGPNDGKITIHVLFTNSGTDPIDINALFWDPDTKIGPGAADVYAAAVIAPIDLGAILEGAAGGFRALATTGVDNTGLTTVAGDIGVSAAVAAAITGFPPGTLTGTKYGTDTAGTVPEDAHTALDAAIADAATRTGAIPLGNALGGLVLTPGVYDVAGAATLAGILTLDGLGDPNAVFIFRCASTFAMAAAASILLLNGATLDNVFFVVGTSATLGAGSVFRGNLLTGTTIAEAGGVGTAVHGRLLADAGAITISAATVIDGL